MNLFDKVMKGAMMRRMGDLTMVTFGTRGGSMMVASMDFQSARKWAQQKSASGNDARDFQQLLARLECFVARYGSGLASRGNRAQLLALARAMQNLGYNHEDWSFPREVADELHQRCELAEAGESYGSIVATCAATLLVEEKGGQGEPQIDYHSVVLDPTEEFIAEQTKFMDYVYTVREINR